MSKIKDLIFDIEDLVLVGYTASEIATKLNAPIDYVKEAIEMIKSEQEYLEEERDQYISDLESDLESDADALASAGWGTDEDYGSYGFDE